MVKKQQNDQIGVDRALQKLENWVEENEASKSFRGLTNSYPRTLDPVMNHITYREIGVRKLDLYFFYLLHINLIAGCVFQAINLGYNEMDLVGYVNAGNWYFSVEYFGAFLKYSNNKVVVKGIVFQVDNVRLRADPNHFL